MNLTAGLTKDVTLFNLPKGAIVTDVLQKPVTAFAGTTTFTGRVITAEHNYGTAFNMKQAVAAETFDSDVVPFRELLNSTVPVLFHAVATVDNLTALTQGSVDIVVGYDLRNTL